MKTTIKDVAKEAGVSVATVSLVFHDEPRISAATKKRVHEAIKKLNYHPSRSARGLVSKNTGNIGFILTDDHFLRTEPFYTRIFLGTEFQARQDKYYVLLNTIPSDYSSDDPLPRFVIEKNVDGIIIAGKVPDSLITKLDKTNLPLIFVDYLPKGKHYTSVQIDNRSGGELATQHLIDYGHTHIGFIGADMDHISISDRFIGYKDCLAKNNIPANHDYFDISEDYPARQNGYYAAVRLLQKQKKITAIFAANDALAIGAMRYCQDNNIKVPDEISIIGFDDVEANLMLDPPLTTIRVPKIELGAEAMQVMVSILKNSDKTKKKIIVPVELIIRKSTKKISS